MTTAVAAETDGALPLPPGVELMEFTCESHYDFGMELGSRFKQRIHSRVKQHVNLQTKLLPYAETPDGKQLTQRFLETHNTVFPEYMEEIRGIADGSEVPFETIFILNLVEEYGTSIPEAFLKRNESTAGAHVAPTAGPDVAAAPPVAIPTAEGTKEPDMRCSDLVLFSQDVQVVAHNEDSGIQDVDNTAFVVATVANQPRFVAFTYAGDLPSGAFGYNARGIGFTLNFVQPTEIDVGALGRGFISRDLLGATSYQDAMDRITRSFQGAGHNYQLMDFSANKIWNVEVASFNRFAVRSFESQKTKVEAFFHANLFQSLAVSQPSFKSNEHRLKRYSEMKPPKTLDEALAVLGDQQDLSYPMFHDKLSHSRGDLSGWTLTTVVFDLMHGIAYTLEGNPGHKRPQLLFNLHDLSQPIKRVTCAEQLATLTLKN